MSEASEKVYESVDKYLHRMREVGKEPQVIRLFAKDYDAALKAHNKGLSEQGKEPAKSLPPYKGLEIVRFDYK